MVEKKMTGRAASIPGGLAIGALVSMIVTVLIAAIGAHLIISEMLPQDKIGYCSIAALLCGAILGALTASGKVKHRKLLVCLLSGMVYFLMLLATTALFFGGQYEGIGVTFVTVSLGSIAAALIASRGGSGSSGTKRKKIRRQLVQNIQLSK